MLDHLPELIDPLEFVDKNRRMRGSIPLSRLDRLREILVRDDGVARVELEFRKEGRIAVVAGRVDAELALECQCCLETMAWFVHSEFRLGIVGSIDEADLLSEEFEPLLVERNALVALTDIVQDELLLGIPSIPQHAQCVLPEARTTQSRAEHPFAALAEMKKANQNQ